MTSLKLLLQGFQRGGSKQLCLLNHSFNNGYIIAEVGWRLTQRVLLLGFRVCGFNLAQVPSLGFPSGVTHTGR